ncbi:MAG: hypothetical protein ACXACW_16015, partial [Candidatus Hodarchaeales archaeon]
MNDKLVQDPLFKIWEKASSTWNFAKKEVIPNIEELTPEGLTRILKKQGYINKGKVLKIIKRESREGFHSNVHFLQLYFSNDIQKEVISSEIVVKIPKTDDLSKLAGKYEA